MFLSRKNQVIRWIIWAIAGSFVISLFFLSGNFLWEMQKGGSKASKEEKDGTKQGDISAANRAIVLASSKDWNITVGQFFDDFRKMDRRMRSRYADRKGREDFLDIMVDRKLLAQAGEEFKIAPTDEEIYEYAKEELAKQVGQNFDIARIKEFFANGLLNKKDTHLQLVFQRLQDKITSPVNYGTSEIEAFYKDNAPFFTENGKLLPLEGIRDQVISRIYYEKHKYRWQNPDSLRLSHILIKPTAQRRQDAATKRILPEDVRNYWEDTKGEYRTPALIEARQILIKKDSKKLDSRIDKSTDELKKYYQKNSDRYLAPPKAKTAHILLNPMADRFYAQARPNEKELRDYYETHLDTFTPKERVKARHILVDQEEMANEIRDKLEDGQDFSALALAHSNCPSKNEGGDLGFFDFDSMVEPFSKVAFSLPIGQISQPVKTSFGWHIIETLEKEEGGQKPFDKVRQEIVDILSEEKAKRLAREKATEIKKKLAEGGDFSALAKKESDAPSKISGGEIGWVYLGNPPSNFDGTKLNQEIAQDGTVDWKFRRGISDLGVGNISEIIESELGFHIAKILEKEGSKSLTFEEAEGELTKDYLSENRDKAGIGLIEELRTRILQERDFSEIAKEFSEGKSAVNGGYLGWFTKGEQPDGTDISLIDGEISGGRFLNNDIEKAIFDEKAKIYEPMVIKSSIGYHLIEIRNKKASEIKPFDLVKKQVQEKLVNINADRLCRLEGEKLLADLQNNKLRFADGAKAHSDGNSASRGGDLGIVPRVGKIKDDAENKSWLEDELASDNFSFEGGQFIMGFMVDNAVSDALRYAKEGIIPSVIKSQFGYHIIKVDEIIQGSFRPFSEIASDISAIVNMKPAEEKIQEYWIENLEYFKTPAQVKVRHIFVQPETDSLDAAQADAIARKKAEDLRKKVVEEGLDFEGVASANNSDYTKENGGDLGWKSRGELSAALDAVAFAMKPQEISDIVKTPFGFHILKLDEEKPEKIQPIDEVRENIEEILMAPQKNKLFEDFIMELRAKADTVRETTNMDAYLMKYN